MGAGILGSKETFVHALVSKQRRRETFPRKGEVFVLWGKQSGLLKQLLQA